MRANELESLIEKYQKNVRRKEYELNSRKEKLYEKLPRLKEIEEEINKISMEKTKSILMHNFSDSMNTVYENKLIQLKKEKKEILKKSNIDENYLKMQYDCDKCKDTGYITYDDKKTEMCSCLKQKLVNTTYNKSNLSNINKENFEKFDISKFSDKINMEKYKINSSPRTNIQAIRNASLKFIENFDNLDTKNLLFTGNTGLR